MKKMKIKNIALAVAFGICASTTCEQAEAGKLSDFLSNAKAKLSNSKIVQSIATSAKKEFSNNLNQQNNAATIEQQGSASEWGCYASSKVNNLTTLCNKLNTEVIETKKLKTKDEGTQKTEAGVTAEKDAKVVLGRADVYMENLEKLAEELGQNATDLASRVKKYSTSVGTGSTVAANTNTANVLELTQLNNSLTGLISEIRSAVNYLGREGIDVSNLVAIITQLEEILSSLTAVLNILTGSNTTFTKADLQS